jgi:hypothetical protein
LYAIHFYIYVLCSSMEFFFLTEHSAGAENVGDKIAGIHHWNTSGWEAWAGRDSEWEVMLWPCSLECDTVQLGNFWHPERNTWFEIYEHRNGFVATFLELQETGRVTIMSGGTGKSCCRWSISAFSPEIFNSHTLCIQTGLVIIFKV